MLKGNITILGYGSQGRAWALNLRDAGRDISVGLRPRSKSRKLAQNDGISNITTVNRAVRSSNIIIFAFPDHLQGRIFEKDIRPNLKPGVMFIFLHGFAIHFKTIIPPDNCDIALLAPLGPGDAVRKAYLEKNDSMGFFYAINQDHSGRTLSILNCLIKDLGIKKKTLIKTTFKEEAIGDLFGEQAVLCGGLSQLIKAGYETLIESGLSSEKAYLETAYQLDLIVELIKKHGVSGMYNRISVAAKYGSLLSGPKIIDTSIKKKMKEVLQKIETGEFARKLNSLNPEKIKKLKRDLKGMTSPSFEKAAGKFSPLNNKEK